MDRQGSERKSTAHQTMGEGEREKKKGGGPRGWFSVEKGGLRRM